MPRLLCWKLAVLAGCALVVTGCCCIDYTCQVGGSGHAPCSASSPRAVPMKVGPEMVLPDGAVPMRPASPPVVSRFHPVPTRPVFAPR